MLQLTIYYGQPGSGKSYNAHRAKETLKATCTPFLIEGVYTLNAFQLLAEIFKDEYIPVDQNDNDIIEGDIHLLVTTQKPLDFFAPVFQDIQNVHLVECNYQPKYCLQ